MSKQLAEYDLQFFAEDETGAEETTSETGAEETKTNENKSFDDFLEENKDFQSAFDSRVTKAIETAKKNWEKAKNKELEDARTEAQKLAKMSADEKAEHERQKREKELKERENALMARELKQGAKDLLIEKKLPVEFSDLIHYTDAETTKSQIEKLETAFNSAVEAKVNERLKGKTPLGSSSSGMSDLEKQISEIFGN